MENVNSSSFSSLHPLELVTGECVEWTGTLRRGITWATRTHARVFLYTDDQVGLASRPGAHHCALSSAEALETCSTQRAEWSPGRLLRVGPSTTPALHVRAQRRLFTLDKYRF